MRLALRFRLAATVLAVFSAVAALAQPVITQQPTSRTNCLGTTAIISVSASGQNPTYQWSLNQNNIAAATSNSYVIPSVASSDAGNYQVIVTDPSGSATSAVAVLSIQLGSSVYFDFNTPGQFANNFQISAAGVLPTAFTYLNAISGGVGNSPCIDFGPN